MIQSFVPTRRGFVTAWLALATLIALGACAPSAPPPAESAPAESASSANAPAVNPTPAPGEVEYEPAYPEEVSEDALSKEDVDQQQTTHSHDGQGEHTHGEGEDGDHEDDHAHP